MFTANLYGDVLFEDDFQNKSNWVKNSSLEGFTIQENSSEIIVDNQTEYTGLLIHDDYFEDFTYEVTMRFESNPNISSGIGFCANNGGAYYFTVRKEQVFTLSKLVGKAFSEIESGWNTFINQSVNTLKVSKQGDVINLFCNDEFLVSVSDNTHSGGQIHLILGPAETTAFLDARITDEYETGTVRKYFADNFDDGNLNGWELWTGGSMPVVENGVVKFGEGSTSGQTLICTDGDYANVPVKIIANRKGGKSNAFYGLILMDVDIRYNDNNQPIRTYKAFVYQINGNRERAAYKIDSAATFTPVGATAITEGPIDTLEINSNREFVVNGRVLPNIDFGETFEFNKVGILVSDSVDVEFDNFVVGDPKDSSSVIFSTRFQSAKSPVFQLGGLGIVYNPLGRQIRSLLPQQGTDQKMNEHMGKGQYIIVPEDPDKAKPHRAVIIR